MKTKHFFAILLAAIACLTLSSFTLDRNNNAASVAAVSEAEAVDVQASSPYAGTYSFTDAAGVKWKIVIKNDNTAVLYRNGKDVDYGSLDEFYADRFGMLVIYFSDYNPEIALPNGTTDSHNLIYIKNGYIYTKLDPAKAQHPKKRLKCTKTK